MVLSASKTNQHEKGPLALAYFAEAGSRSWLALLAGCYEFERKQFLKKQRSPQSVPRLLIQQLGNAD